MYYQFIQELSSRWRGFAEEYWREIYPKYVPEKEPRLDGTRKSCEKDKLGGWGSSVQGTAEVVGSKERRHSYDISLILLQFCPLFKNSLKNFFKKCILTSSVQLSGKYIHVAMKQISRTFSSCKTYILSQLGGSSPFPPLLSSLPPQPLATTVVLSVNLTQSSLASCFSTLSIDKPP